MNLYVYLWLAVALVFGIAEAATLSLTSIWFVGGALLALAAAAFNLQLWFQLVVFVIVSALLLIFTRPVVSKYLKVGKAKTNVDSVIGQHAVVIEDIDNIQGSGQIKAGGLVWSARSDDNHIIHAGCMVEIIRITGVRAYVRPLSKDAQTAAPAVTADNI